MICNEELSLFDLNDNRTVEFLETLINVSNIYGLFHEYVCLVICVLGSCANIVHIFVLTRPVMQKCAVNRLLSIIAVCDIFTMLSYLVFIIRFGFAVNLANPPPGYALKWIVFLLTHVVGSIALHSITLYLSCVTAYIRYKTLKKVGSKWNHENAAGPIFVVVAVFVVLLCIPTFLIHSVVKVVVPVATDDGQQQLVNETLYTVGLADFNTFSTCFVFKLNLWLTGIMFKVIPCILLMLFTVALLWELELNRRRRRLITSGTTPASRKSSAHSDRTTKVLIILLLIFLCTEFPQGVLAILNGIFPNDVHQFVYLSLGEILDLLSLINCNTCFIVYPLISTQYRETLRGFVRRVRYKFYHCAAVRRAFPFIHHHHHHNCGLPSRLMTATASGSCCGGGASPRTAGGSFRHPSSHHHRRATTATECGSSVVSEVSCGSGSGCQYCSECKPRRHQRAASFNGARHDFCVASLPLRPASRLLLSPNPGAPYVVNNGMLQCHHSCGNAANVTPLSTQSAMASLCSTPTRQDTLVSPLPSPTSAIKVEATLASGTTMVTSATAADEPESANGSPTAKDTERLLLNNNNSYGNESQRRSSGADTLTYNNRFFPNGRNYGKNIGRFYAASGGGSLFRYHHHYDNGGRAAKMSGGKTTASVPTSPTAASRFVEPLVTIVPLPPQGRQKAKEDVQLLLLSSTQNTSSSVSKTPLKFLDDIDVLL